MFRLDRRGKWLPTICRFGDGMVQMRLGGSGRTQINQMVSRQHGRQRWRSPGSLPLFYSAPACAYLTTADAPNVGSPTAANTIGITDVACFAATVGGVADVTMTSTLRRTKSAAISARCSLRPSAHRYSIVMVLRWQPGASRRIQGRRDELLGPRSGTDPVAEPASRWPLRVRRPAAPAPTERAGAPQCNPRPRPLGHLDHRRARATPGGDGTRPPSTTSVLAQD